MTNDDMEQIWKRLGLDELRQALVTVVVSAQRFEQALRKLPSCNACARVGLLENIEDSGKTLGSEVIDLTVLAATLKNAVAKTEKTKEQLEKNVLHSCGCGEQKCSCHNERD